MLQKYSFFRKCVKHAWRDSLGQANNWATLLGGVVIWSFLEWRGITTTLPDTYQGALLLAFASGGAAWLTIFSIRFFLAPADLYAECLAKVIELEEGLTTKKSKEKLRERLGMFALQGKHLLARCSDISLPSPKEDTTLWSKRVEEFLEQNFERSYIARFRTPTDNVENTQMPRGERREMWAGIRFRMVNLNKFIDENLE
jgi:hypothetical protein